MNSRYLRAIEIDYYAFSRLRDELFALMPPEKIRRELIFD
jgi:hypothetical protein